MLDLLCFEVNYL